jgi:hypothetical protein
MPAVHLLGHAHSKTHDVLFFYSKSSSYQFYPERMREPRSEKTVLRIQNPKGARISADNKAKLPTDVWPIAALTPMATERLRYPTQKPEALFGTHYHGKF